MKNLLRAAAVCTLALTALSTVEAATYGTCQFICAPLSGHSGTTVSISLTWNACCNGNISQYCPPGYYGALGASWNRQLCPPGYY